MGLDDVFEDFPKVSVSQYTSAIKKTLEGAIPPCWVLGEVSNLRLQSSGHIYFSLKDSSAQVPAVMFRGQASRLNFKPSDGMQVLAFGEISVYEPHGRFQLIVRELRESGEGRLYQEFERLKRKLSEEGLFDSEWKRELPALPLKIAIVTSPTGAALQDFIRILKRRNWTGTLQVFPVRVQGAEAAAEIESAIRYVNDLGGYDGLVVARGGGSIEDLWPFNEERVARAVAESSVPVVSGVGHEIDFTLSDFAADVRAETPSAAAEMISSIFLDTLNRILLARECLEEGASAALQDCVQSLDRARRSLKSVSPEAVLEKSFLRIDELSTRFASSFKSSVYDLRSELRGLERRFMGQDVDATMSRWRDRVDRSERRLSRGLSEGVIAMRSRLSLIEATLKAIGPEATLKRGYAILSDESGNVLPRVASTEKGQRLIASLSDGSMRLTVDSVEPESS